MINIYTESDFNDFGVLIKLGDALREYDITVEDGKFYDDLAEEECGDYEVKVQDGHAQLIISNVDANTLNKIKLCSKGLNYNMVVKYKQEMDD